MLASILTSFKMVICTNVGVLYSSTCACMYTCLCIQTFQTTKVCLRVFLCFRAPISFHLRYWSIENAKLNSKFRRIGDL
uniref:Uncharacterized protein n=1 Tax=Rhipicephalus pulchellus TaxID=72859 RepID=L7LU68_RHIPC